MVVNHSVKLSFDLRFTRLCLKNCMLKKPLTARPKMRLETALPTKNCTLIKAFHRASLSGEGAICSLKKTVAQNKPFHRPTKN